MFNPEEEFKKLEPVYGDECSIAVSTSEEKRRFNKERDRIFLELGIDIYNFDDREDLSEEEEKYEDYCEEAVDCVDNHRPIPDEVREYLLREKAKRAGQSQGSPSHLVQF